MDRDEFMRRRYGPGRYEGSEERWFDDSRQWRRAPREAERGRYGEIEYGQNDPWAVGRSRRSDAASWPQERMGMGEVQPYWSPSQWGGGMGFGPNVGATGYDNEYRWDRGGYAEGDAPQTREGGSRSREGYMTEGPWSRSWHDHDYGHGGFSGRGPKGYKRTDDRIHEDVCERLTRHPDIDASEIEIEVKDGEVTMTGHVHRRQAKHMAEDVVDAVSGVREVHNELKVKKHAWGEDRETPSRSRGVNGQKERDRDREKEREEGLLTPNRFGPE